MHFDQLAGKQATSPQKYEDTKKKQVLSFDLQLIDFNRFVATVNKAFTQGSTCFILRFSFSKKKKKKLWVPKKKTSKMNSE